MLLIPPADLDVPGFGRVYVGQPVDMPAELAGEAPDPRFEPAMVELRDAIAAVDHITAQARRDELATLSPGRGFLAQGWKLAPSAKAAKAVSTDPAPAGAPEGN